MPLILGTNSIKDTGYDVANSLRFNSGSSDYLSRSTGVTTTNTKFTLSFWIKLCDTANYQQVFEVYKSSSERINCGFNLDNANQPRFFIQEYTGSYIYRKIFTRLSRDVSAWTHYVIKFDSSEAEANRLRVYINGVEETATDQANLPGSGATSIISVGTQHIGYSQNNSGHYLNGYLAEFVLIEGTDYDPTSFGEFDEDSPTIWKPKDVSGLTFGTNGFYLDFENASSLGADVSGQGNNFTVNNLTSVAQSTDTCTNNFCTLNPLGFTEGTLSQGNLEIDQNGSAGRFCASTFQVTQGKWYYEAKLLNYGSDPRPSLGVGRNEETYTGNAHQGASSIVYGLENAVVFKDNGTAFAYDSSPSSGDIYGVAFDLDNLKIYFHKNGTYFNSGDPANGTGNVTTLVSGRDYSPITGALNTSSNSARNNDWQFNFGSPPYSISSGNSDANGFGNFEYSVPSGYFSLCSSNLAESG